MKRTVFTIDPGISGTGIAVWDYNHFKNQLPDLGSRKYPIFSPEKVMQMRFGTKFEYLYELRAWIKRLDCHLVICEDADFRRGDKGSMVAESGDLVTLAKFIGSVEATVLFENIPVELVTANKWKGQLDKKKTVDRIKKIWPGSVDVCGNEKTAHAWDAVGIGFWKLGLF